jgi:NAD(P)-dependent dehydrogenase (short-subunit alcohol dehydrogenase family)
MTDQALAGRTAVVTGAGSGIGRGIALHAGRLGMNVVLAEIDETRLKEAVAEVGATGAETLGVVTDVTDAAAVDALADAAYDAFGEVALLVNNAGIESVGYVWDLDPDRWSRMMRVNTDGVFHGIRAFVPRMGADDAPSYVVNVASVAAVTTGPMNAAYHASKHATLALTECLSLECRMRYPQISASVVCPGSVSTQIFADAVLAEGDEREGPAGMLGYLRDLLDDDGLTPAQVAEAVFAGVAAGDFWIQTHPGQFAEFAGRRAAMLTEQTPPALPQVG